MWLVYDEVLLVWKISSEKHAENYDKCGGMKD